ncbi:ATP-binding protein [Aureimonas endophytica]|uniref:ATP-binding protein n=1 Tax=Aureimonas endophytica TaxID=2027858 RepID=UPI0016630684|nr:ATP-binding protein [Aureimonas endophytica]
MGASFSQAEDQDALLTALAASATVRSILDVVCETTGMGFAAVAHVTASRWVACQVRDDIAFGLPAGGELPVASTLCDTIRRTGEAIVIDEVARDPLYRHHHTPALYGLESYIAYPIVLSDGALFGTLCAIDPKPRQVDVPRIRAMVRLFAQLVATEVERIRATADGEAARRLNACLEERVAAALAEKKVHADIIDSSTAAVTALGLDGRILAINRANLTAFERVYGKRPAPGDDFLSLFAGAPDHLEQQRAIWARALAGEAFAIVQEFGDPGRERRSYEVRFAPLLDGEGRRICASSTSYDVTDRVKAEAELAAAQEQLHQARKMEAMGQLTGGVAHYFNNLLTPIVGGLDLLRRRGLGGEREQRLIAAAAQSAERARLLVQRLLAFARRQPLQPSAVDLAGLVGGMADLVSSTIGSRIELAIELADALPPAHADANQLEMALLNLCVNARDAMPEGGTLRIAASAEAVGAGHATGLSPGGYLRLSIADTGAGMDAATLARAVEPFFSTKGIGKGTGLGLSMVDGLARQLGGMLQLESRLGAGTTASLWLPASGAGTAPAPAPADAGLREARRGGIVLLVEDEELVRLSTAAMLGELGYRVVEAASAEEALARLREGLRPDCVVTDHLMPGMTGGELARTLALDHPGLPALIVSGYADRDDLAAEFALLSKPFRRDELRDSLAALSASRSMAAILG